MKTTRITLLLAALAFLAQASFAQVLITDDPATFPNANTNAVLDLKSLTKPLILPVIPYNNFLNITPDSGMICVTTGVPGFDDPTFHNLQFYMDEPGTGDDAWVRVITGKNNISALQDVRTGGDATGFVTSYYIGREAGLNGTNAARHNTVLGVAAGKNLQGEDNTLIGYQSGEEIGGVPASGTGAQNTAVGVGSGRNVSTGKDNTFVGFYATALDLTDDGDIIESTALGVEAKTSGNSSTALGANAKTNGFLSTAVGAYAETTADHQVVLGTTTEYVTLPGLFNADSSATAIGTKAVYVTDKGNLVVTSSKAPESGHLNEKLDQLEQENAALKARLEKLEALVEELVGQGN